MTVQADAERVEPRDLEAWGAWLEANHTRKEGVWLVSWKKGTGRQAFTYEEAVTEALRFGWIDGVARTLDEQRTMRWYAPRRPGSGWARSNKQRIARLETEGRMHPAGRAAVEAAKADGSWTMLDDAEDLVVPADLAEALDRHPGSRERWDAFPPSARKAILGWIAQAKRPETRAGRIARTASEAARGRRPGG